MFGSSSLLNWMNGLPAAVDFSYVCIYGFSFSAIAALHVIFSAVYSLHLFIISVAVPSRRLAEHICVHANASACIDFSFRGCYICILNRIACYQTIDMIIFYCNSAQKPTIDFKPIILPIDLSISTEKKPYFIYSMECVFGSDWRYSHMN